MTITKPNPKQRIEYHPDKHTTDNILYWFNEVKVPYQETHKCPFCGDVYWVRAHRPNAISSYLLTHNLNCWKRKKVNK